MTSKRSDGKEAVADAIREYLAVRAELGMPLTASTREIGICQVLLHRGQFPVRALFVDLATPRETLGGFLAGA